MKLIRLLFLLLWICVSRTSFSQDEETDKSLSISVFSGVMNYMGDVKPDNFTMTHSNPVYGVTLRKPINRFFTLRAGYHKGKITAADYWNPEDLRPRNLSFTSDIKEAYLGLEITLLDITTSRFTPYMYVGGAMFHFNPWTKDQHGVKTYLMPLSTEGQGLAEYPDRKPYKLTQFSIPFGAGVRLAITDGINLGFEFNERKTFTDYLDDVSGTYVDRDVLQRERGSVAVALAYRADEVPGGRPLFPNAGEKRGTPTQMDWYYFLGFTLEAKLNKLTGLVKTNHNHYIQKCPKRLY